MLIFHLGFYFFYFLLFLSQKVKKKKRKKREERERGAERAVAERKLGAVMLWRYRTMMARTQLASSSSLFSSSPSSHYSSLSSSPCLSLQRVRPNTHHESSLDREKCEHRTTLASPLNHLGSRGVEARGFATKGGLAFAEGSEKNGNDEEEGGAETNVMTMYDMPHLYDRVFGFRDYGHEVEFIADVYGRHQGGGADLKTVLDLGCGTGRHCLALAEKGYQVTGLDSSRSMLDYAERLVASNKGVVGGEIEFVQQDMTRFSFNRRKFEVVTMLLGTLSHVHSNEDVVRCFDCVREHLSEEGVFILELAHPSQLFTLPLELGMEAWDVHMDDLGKEDLVVQYGLEEDTFDPMSQLLTRTVVVTHPKKKKKKGRDVLDELPLEEKVVQRYFTCQEIKLLAELSGLKVEKLFGDMSKTCVLGSEEDEEFRMVVVLKKKK